MTRNTRIIASPSVNITSRIDTSTNRVVSYGTEYASPSGKRFASSATSALTVFATESAFAPGARNTPISVADLPLMRPMNS